MLVAVGTFLLKRSKVIRRPVISEAADELVSEQGVITDRQISRDLAQVQVDSSC